MADVAPVGLVYEEQSLRFHLRGSGFTTPTLTGPDGQVQSEFGVLVANEYGLWRKADLSSIGRGLRIELAGPGKGLATLELVHCENENSLTDDDIAAVENVVHLKLNEGAKMMSTLKVQLSGAPVVLQAELIDQGERHVENVCSMPIFSASHELQHRDALACILHNAPEARQCRALKIPSPGGIRQIFIAEAPSYLGIGGKVWDATWDALQWLEQSNTEASASFMEQWITGKHVLELGSGTGSLALALANRARPTSMTMTDLPDIVQLLEFNVSLNKCLSGEEGDDSHCMFQCASVPWGDVEAAQAVLARGTKFNAILLCDLIYQGFSAEPLVQTLELLCPADRRDEQQALLVYRHRHDECNILFTLLDVHFEVVRLTGLPKSDMQFFSIRRKSTMEP